MARKDKALENVLKSICQSRSEILFAGSRLVYDIQSQPINSDEIQDLKSFKNLKEIITGNSIT